jgi:hypothetical protein
MMTAGAENYIPDNGILERFHKTMLNSFYRIAFRKKLYGSIEAAGRSRPVA